MKVKRFCFISFGVLDIPYSNFVNPNSQLHGIVFLTENTNGSGPQAFRTIISVNCHLVFYPVDLPSESVSSTAVHPSTFFPFTIFLPINITAVRLLLFALSTSFYATQTLRCFMVINCFSQCRVCSFLSSNGCTIFFMGLNIREGGGGEYYLHSNKFDIYISPGELKSFR